LRGRKSPVATVCTRGIWQVSRMGVRIRRIWVGRGIEMMGDSGAVV
jgi:hypothetical protein